MTSITPPSERLECNFCGTKEGVKQFEPSDEMDGYIPIFCYKCFMSEECTSDEPMTQEEKQRLWDDTK